MWVEISRTTFLRAWNIALKLAIPSVGDANTSMGTVISATIAEKEKFTIHPVKKKDLIFGVNVHNTSQGKGGKGAITM